MVASARSTPWGLLLDLKTRAAKEVESFSVLGRGERRKSMERCRMAQSMDAASEVAGYGFSLLMQVMTRRMPLLPRSRGYNSVIDKIVDSDDAPAHNLQQRLLLAHSCIISIQGSSFRDAQSTGSAESLQAHVMRAERPATTDQLPRLAARRRQTNNTMPQTSIYRYSPHRSAFGALIMLDIC
ncbi:hypothetical protein BDV95DRAFT_72541 [Massariosphaeria phaeospora]|uniref:Uncharacterized protein n=1 Tax=Massariosphaeria phaeospora TaxID=100035 RepID=A0A7C8M7S1_9PLEO|nr:hypothetical protein BDV95DRAFT_72541 [Massariosphaeria phaeospora]